jgi:multicomponent Na+:H+ antiporter subunit D
VLGAVEGGRWGVALVAVVSTLLTLAYFARVVERMYFRDAPAPAEESVAAAADGGDAELASDGGSDGDDDASGAASDAGAEPETISMTARVIVVGAAVAAVGVGLVATDLIAVFEPVLEVYF